MRSELLGKVEEGRDGEIREEMRWVAQEGRDGEVEGGEIGVEKRHCNSLLVCSMVFG